MIDFEDCSFSHTEKAYPFSKKVKLSKPNRLPIHTGSLRKDAIDPDMEMGFLPLLAAAVPMVTSLAGSLLSKKSKSGGGPPPEAAQAQGVLDILTKAMGGDSAQGENTFKEVVRNIVSTVPSPIQKQVLSALKEIKNAEKANVESRTTLVNKIDAKFAPQITAMLAALKAGQIQKQATYEHNKLKEKGEFRKGTTQTLADIQRRLITIEQRFARSALVQGENKIALFGGRSALER